MAIVTLTTDYGSRDAYAGTLKGVILGIAPKATVVDITHEIEPYNIVHGAFVLGQIWPWFPEGTIHVAVVDPGVGSDRRILVAQYAGRIVVTPDNGLLTFVHREFHAADVRVVEDRRFFLATLSATFHGRDILAPVAAHAANGVKLREFGRVADHIELLPVSYRAEAAGDGFRGSVLYVDRFGTLVTNVRAEQLSAPRIHARDWQVTVNSEAVGAIRAAFHEVPVGRPVALVGGSGLLEIAVHQGRAADYFGLPGQASIEVH